MLVAQRIAPTYRKQLSLVEGDDITKELLRVEKTSVTRQYKFGKIPLFLTFPGSCSQEFVHRCAVREGGTDS